MRLFFGKYIRYNWKISLNNELCKLARNANYTIKPTPTIYDLVIFSFPDFYRSSKSRDASDAIRKAPSFRLLRVQSCAHLVRHAIPRHDFHSTRIHSSRLVQDYHLGRYRSVYFILRRSVVRHLDVFSCGHATL